ncbi:asparagine synthase-related protein [Halomonas sp. TA6]|nr:asparagine synthase-related protein [Halomonas sp. TA6]
MTIFSGWIGEAPKSQHEEIETRLKSAFASFPKKELLSWSSSNVIMTQSQDVTAPPVLNGEGVSIRNNGVILLSSARLDNVNELKSGLILANHDKSTTDHARLIGSAYGKWQKKCIENITGDFSFALWDESKRELFCARDRLGVRPFYYHKNKYGLWFSNNLRVLISSIGFLPEVNKKRAILWLQGIERETSLTFFEGIFRLQAGHTLVATPDKGPCIEEYWHLNNDMPEIEGTLEQNSLRFRELFMDSIRTRMDCPGNVGIELSGGHDSSAICSSAALLDRGRLRSYSALFPSNPECDESFYINKVNEESGILNQSINAEALSVVDYYDKSILAHGDCHHAANIRIVMRIQELAKHDGCNVILNGVDGDNVASHGLYRLTELAVAGKWNSFIDQAKSISDIYGAFYKNPDEGIFTTFGKAILQEKSNKKVSIEVICAVFLLAYRMRINARHLVKQNMVKPWMRKLGVNKGAKPGNVIVKDRLGRYSADQLDESFINETGYKEYLQDYLSSRQRYISENQAQHSFLTSGVNEQYFEYTHSISELNNIETRFPFMDQRLIEFCLALPADNKLDNGWTRLILRAAMKDIYPASIGKRREKSNLAPSVEGIIVGQCFADLKEAVQRPDEEIWQFFSAKGVDSMIKNYNPHDDNIYASQADLWSIWCLRRWLSLRETFNSSVGSSTNRTLLIG